MLDYAFGGAGLTRVGVRVLASNTRAIRCHAACGFQHTGVARNAVQIGDAWHDDILMTITPADDFTKQSG